MAFANALRSLAEDAETVLAEAAMMVTATARGLAFMVMMDRLQLGDGNYDVLLLPAGLFW